MAWYDINKTLSYNCLFNFVIGNRGSGKTYGGKKRAIKQFLEKGHQFIYLRRFKEELDETADSYFNDIILNREFPNATIEYKNGCYFVNDRLAGYAMALTKAKDYKSISYPLVYLILFDEFLSDYENSVSTSGHIYMASRANCMMNLSKAADEMTGGLENLFFLRKIKNNMKLLSRKLTEISKKIF